MQLVLETILFGALGVFFACVLTLMFCPLVVMFQLRRIAGTYNPLSISQYYLSASRTGDLPESVQRIFTFMRRVSRLATNVWWVALAAGLSLALVATVTTSPQ